MTATQFDVPLTSAPAARLLADTRYVLAGFPRALAAGVIGTVGVTLGLGLAVLWVGVPLLLGTLAVTRGFADAERARLRSVLGDLSCKPHCRTARAADPQSWWDLGHALLRFLPSSLAFGLVVSWWGSVIGGVTWGLWGWALPDRGLPYWIGIHSYQATVVLYLILAGLFALSLPAVARRAALMEARFARKLLVR
jgi:hypothetical protein